MSTKRRHAETGLGPFVLPDSDFVLLCPTSISRALHLYDTDTNVRIVVEIKMNSLLGGDITFTRSKETKKITNPQLSHLWGEWCRKVMRCLWSVGFAATLFIEGQDAMAPPSVLDLDQLDVRYYKDFCGNSEYRFYRRNATQGGMFSFGEIVTGVEVIELDQPRFDGTIHSKMTELAADILFESNLMSCATVANLTRSAPHIITEQEKPPYDPNAIPSAWDFKEPNKSITSSVFQQHTLPDERILNLKRMERLGVLNDRGKVATSSSSSSSSGSEHGLFIHLESGRKLVKQNMAEAPENLLDFRMERRQTVFNIFGVPLSMMTNDTNAGGAGVLSSRPKEGINMVFNEDQKRLKLFLLRVMKHVYVIQNAKTSLEEYQATLKPDEKVDSIKASEFMDIQIEMPGIPDESSLRDMYLLGFLKPEKFVTYLSSKHGIPLEGFYETPKLSLEDANGIKPDPDSKLISKKTKS